jgi:hypothetical protein
MRKLCERRMGGCHGFRCFWLGLVCADYGKGRGLRQPLSRSDRLIRRAQRRNAHDELTSIGFVWKKRPILSTSDSILILDAI